MSKQSNAIGVTHQAGRGWKNRAGLDGLRRRLLGRVDVVAAGALLALGAEFRLNARRA